ncbi:ribonuclease P protein component [Daejeonella sp.]|jgi:ribonuclease P protein component|uniref:ribonuclease P protein component n=1 Tax=Daejeonella sp. TaxID=2805397 RepID=UPI0037C1335F
MNSLKKEERLCNIKLIEKLYHSGSSFLVYPFRIIWHSSEAISEFPVQILISVPKKKFKRAVDRNLLKRRIREIYRTQKAENLFPFLNERSEKIVLGINYIGNEIAEYVSMEKKFNTAMLRLKKNISEQTCSKSL